MSFASIWLGILAALLAQRCAVVRMDRRGDCIAAGFCAALLAVGAAFRLIGWATA